MDNLNGFSIHYIDLNFSAIEILRRASESNRMELIVTRDEKAR